MIILIHPKLDWTQHFQPKPQFYKTNWNLMCYFVSINQSILINAWKNHFVYAKITQCHVLYVLILFSSWVFFFLIPFVLHVLFYHFWFFKRCNSNNFFPNKNYYHQIWLLPQKSWKYWSNKSSKMIGKLILTIYLKLNFGII